MSCRSALLVDECGQAVRVEEFLGSLLYFLGGYLVDVVEQLVDVALPAVVEEALAEVECKLFAGVTGNGYLTLELSLGGG